MHSPPPPLAPRQLIVPIDVYNPCIAMPATSGLCNVMNLHFVPIILHFFFSALGLGHPRTMAAWCNDLCKHIPTFLL